MTCNVMGLFQWDFWPCTVKPCRADLRLLKKKKKLILPAMLCERDKAILQLHFYVTTLISPLLLQIIYLTQMLKKVREGIIT